MPKDDWAKYARQDRARSAVRDGSAIVIQPGKRRQKRRRKSQEPRGHKGICRCCGGKKRIGREDICLGCYKRFKHQVHAIANRESGPYRGTVRPQNGLQPTSGTLKSGHSSIESEMTHK